MVGPINLRLLPYIWLQKIRSLNLLNHGFNDNIMFHFAISGIGIDDMFVIIASWNNLSHEQKQLQVREQAGLTLRHAVGIHNYKIDVCLFCFILFVCGGCVEVGCVCVFLFCFVFVLCCLCLFFVLFFLFCSCCFFFCFCFLFLFLFFGFCLLVCLFVDFVVVNVVFPFFLFICLLLFVYLFVLFCFCKVTYECHKMKILE